jgi:AbrB family looped-hinge helix DNA binding protein
MTTATISSKGQITIPKKIRDRHHLKSGDKIEFLEDAQEKPVSIKEMNKAIADEGGKI